MLLLVIIAISYISVGLPDSVLGSLWPTIYADMNLPISLAGFISMTVSGCTAVSCLFSARLIKRFGTGTVTFFSCFLTAIALLLLSRSQNIAYFFILSVPLGVGAGTVDAALNSFVALFCSASQMSYLHCFYGLGVTMSPYLISCILSAGNSWRTCYLIVGGIQLTISIIILLSGSYWRKAEKGESEKESEEIKVLSLKAMLAKPSVVLSCIMFFFVCAAEYTAGSWAATYFVEHKGITAEKAPAMAMFYYIGVTVGRFISGVLGKKLDSHKIINFSFITMLLSIPVLAFSSSDIFAVFGLFLFGLGMGPTFPNLSFIVPELFGRDVSRSIIGIQLASTYIGIMIMPTVYGIIAEKFSSGLLPIMLLILIIIYFLSEILMKKSLKYTN